MPMGIVSDKEFQRALEDATPPSKSPSKNPPTIIPEIIPMEEKGRGNGNVEVPNSLRQLIGEESAISGRASALEIANNFGISPSSVSAYANGSTSTASMDQQPGLDKLNEAKLRVAKKARNRLVMALNSLTQEKIDAAKAKDIAGVAKDMSSVIRSMEPEGPKVSANGPTFIFYSPQMKREDAYDMIRVKE